MNRIVALVCAGLIAAPTVAVGGEPMPPGLLVAAKAGSVQLNLGEKDGRCTIRSMASQQEQILDIAAPCGFVRKSDAAPAQMHAYKNVGSVLVVAGPPAQLSEYASQSSVQPSFQCSNEGQPVFVNGASVRIGEAKQIRLGFCHRLGFDEKDFYAFAHPAR